jgi:hypothetical protein
MKTASGLAAVGIAVLMFGCLGAPDEGGPAAPDEGGPAASVDETVGAAEQEQRSCSRFLTPGPFVVTCTCDGVVGAFTITTTAPCNQQQAVCSAFCKCSNFPGPARAEACS